MTQRILCNLPLIQIPVNDWDHKKELWNQVWTGTDFHKKWFDVYVLDENKNKKPITQTRIVDDQYFSDRNVGHDYTENFANIFQEELQQFRQETNYDSFQIVACWTVAYMKDGSQTAHTHTRCSWSMILPIQQTEDHPKTVFMQPFPNVWNGMVEHIPLINSCEGLMTFFPSWLMHYAPTNNSDTTRIVTSIDIMPNL
jgi:hypothetical protein